MSDIEYIGKSDWDDQDLLFHADARERLVVEIRTVQEELAAEANDSRREVLTHRLGLLGKRLGRADRAIAAGS